MDDSGEQHNPGTVKLYESPGKAGGLPKGIIGMIADLPVFESPLMTFTVPEANCTIRGEKLDRRGQSTIFFT